MIALSPQSELEHLIRVLCSYGREDDMVPAIKAEGLIGAFRGSHDRQYRIVEGAGHDLDQREEEITRKFVVRTFLLDKDPQPGPVE